ncbi:hypothetical protein GCM10009642_46900 [Nocardiopsis metallicus]|uniref:Uncharacterized protein n=1 Tax=Nocardiopsis metallicus TaxID=179819 RepID=A0A840W3S9_9ACTN|nr:hypothetical protein [Nocardiopsis metallicus]
MPPRPPRSPSPQLPRAHPAGRGSPGRVTRRDLVNRPRPGGEHRADGGFPLSEAGYANGTWPLSEVAVGAVGLAAALAATALPFRALTAGHLRRLPGIAVLLLVPLPLVLG